MKEKTGRNDRCVRRGAPDGMGANCRRIYSHPGAVQLARENRGVDASQEAVFVQSDAVPTPVNQCTITHNRSTIAQLIERERERERGREMNLVLGLIIRINLHRGMTAVMYYLLTDGSLFRYWLQFKDSDGAITDVIMKAGDDLRQDQVVLGMLRKFNEIWAREGVVHTLVSPHTICGCL